MSEEQAGERTEQPTEKRLRKAREDGNVPRSRELSTALVFSAGVFSLSYLGEWMAKSAMTWMKSALTPPSHLYSEHALLFGYFGKLLLGLIVFILPLALICLVISVLGPYFMGSLRYSSKSLMPDLNKLNPINGLKRIYGPDSLAELFKSLLRVILIITAAGMYIWHNMDRLQHLLQQPLREAITNGLGFTITLLMATAGSLLLLASIDVPYQKWNYIRKLKMTRQELKQEYKESEGSPEIKGKIRQMQRQLSQGRMMEAVPTADVIIVNPTHYSVALKYDDGSMRAPKVVAKGTDEVAIRIREVAAKHNIAVVSAPPLARSLYREAKIDQEIPVRLYEAVAQVLSYVYQLKAWKTGEIKAHPELPPIEVEEINPKNSPL